MTGSSQELPLLVRKIDVADTAALTAGPMATPDKSPDGFRVLSLAPVVAIRDSAALRAALLSLFQTEKKVRINGTAVERADLSLVQLLIAARQMALRDGIDLDLVLPPSGVIVSLIRQSGLEHAFPGLG